MQGWSCGGCERRRLTSTICTAAAAAVARHDHPLFETLAEGNVHCGDLYQPSVNGEGAWLVLQMHSPHTSVTHCLHGTTCNLVLQRRCG
jgi:hypothetical protein